MCGAAAAGLDPTDLTVFGSEVLFSGLDANGLSGLWVTDGTANGTHELLAEAAGATAAKDPLGLNPNDLTVFNGEVFFSGLDKFGRQQLWETDGTAAGTQMLTVRRGLDVVRSNSVQSGGLRRPIAVPGRE